MNAGRMVAKLDSATAMLRALAGFRRGRDFPMLGGRAQAEPLAAGLLGLVNWLPEGLREQLYIYSGWSEATPPGKLAAVRSDAERPEAEWGFEPALGEDVERFAADRGYRLRRSSSTSRRT
jgi:hypothetical protein